MRIMIAAAALALCAGTAFAQTPPDDSSTRATEHSTGRTVAPETKGAKQPQGHTGPLETTGRSAPASSPQGQTPPGMQAAPEGSDKTIAEPAK
jgi:hypothetical protein